MRRSHSYSKRDALDTCLRQYFFEYYASAKRLSFDAGRKDLVRGLKEFTGTYLLAGEVLHWFIEHFLKKGPTARAWLERTSLDRFDRALRYSRDPVGLAGMRDEQYPPPMLLEFYYQDPRAGELADSARESLLRGIRNFLEDDAVVALRRLVTAGEHWVEKRMAKLPKVDGYGIEGKIDLAGRDSKGVRVIDWKLGRPGSGHDSLQLLIYGMWAEKEFGLDPAAVRVQRVFLGVPAVEDERPLNRALLRAARARLIQDIELMQEMDPYGREGNEEAFSPCAKPNVCRRCKYQQVCKDSCSGLSPRRTSVSLPLLTAVV
jgi:CRISPR/Cas system-associated exonuclease Cas4 (RecB family)